MHNQVLKLLALLLLTLVQLLHINLSLSLVLSLTAGRKSLPLLGDACRWFRPSETDKDLA